MRTYIFILSIILTHALPAQITLKECIESGWANSANHKAAQTEVVLAGLKTIESKARYLPQINLAYEYRYNPIIATQIIPLGQFNPIPTDETRPIQFGTTWQQNAGMTMYLPFIDATLQNRIRESKLNESLSGIDLKKAKADLAFEIAQSYSQVLTLGYQVEESISDTVRSYQSFLIVNTQYTEGKVLKTEVNNALVNHYANVANFRERFAHLINEKIYLHYLTGIQLERIVDESFSPLPESLYADDVEEDEVQFDSIPDFRRFKTEEMLIQQKMKTERTNYTPAIGLEGFLGANQFSQTFDPFLADSWFGSSYVGLSVKLPIFSADKSVNGEKQLQTQLMVNNYRQAEFITERNMDLLRKNIEIEKLEAELVITANSLRLQAENVKLYQERLQNGQFAAIELNTQEAELQKLSNQLNQLKEQLSKALIERWHISGRLTDKLNVL